MTRYLVAGGDVGGVRHPIELAEPSPFPATATAPSADGE